METLELNAPPKEMRLAPVSAIVRNLDRMYGRKNWPGFELETLSLDMGFVFDELIQDKINVLQLLVENPDAYFGDVLFFLHAVGVINNCVADFDTFPFPSSLEIAYAHHEVSKILPGKKYSEGVLKAITHALKLEGFSKPVWPFDIMGVKQSDLHEGQTEQDTKDKERAVRQYIEQMDGDPQ